MNLTDCDFHELDNFDTIDDKVLADLMVEHDNNYYKTDQTNTNSTMIPQQNQINTQVINQNVPPQFHVPQMYFPQSNVTINYNFGK